MSRLKDERVLLAHGAGGKLTHELVNKLFRPAFSNPALNALDDAAVLAHKSGGMIALTTDSFVVDPLIFPGGDIGKLAVCGTVNDLAMKGARPMGIAISAIIEEGFSMKELALIVRSVATAAKEAGVAVVTGDTKVVGKGKADRLFLTTSGVGAVIPGTDISGANAAPGDAILINGSIAEHGIAVLMARNDFKLKSGVRSDCAPLNRLVECMLNTRKNVHVLRDPTRGGVATTLNEIAAASNVGIVIEEGLIPLKREVKSACDILGLDPLYVANEGKLLCVLPENAAGAMVGCMRREKYGKASARIGCVVTSPKGVWIKTVSGGIRPLVMMESDQLPRIC